jgi:DNA-binding NarL/FixJ family response regulator
VTGKPATAAPNTLRAAIRLGLLRVVGEQRYRDRVEELDRMADGVLAEIKRFQRANIRRRTVVAGIGPYQDQLLQLLAAGHDVAGIAELLGRPWETVAEDLRHLYAVLGAKDRLGAVVAGYELGILLPGRLKPVTR